MERLGGHSANDTVEVRFKNTRKDFYRNPDGVTLNPGDIVAVEALSGHDVGVVSLTGELVRLQMNRKKAGNDGKELRKVYRKARQADIDKWQEAREREKPTMFKARKTVSELGLNMKIGDVEYQADQTKATFYYTADERVDFRQLIKVLADQFRIRIEMRQIGARQEAGRLGGIGSCGRELCCSTWLTDFRSVSTSAARYQQLSINPVKLAGQCGKLKCCLNYELDTYLDALKQFPNNEPRLKTQKGLAYHQKTDIFKGLMWYTYEDDPSNFISLSVDRVKEIASLNEKGERPSELKNYEEEIVVEEPDYENVVGQDSLTRFDNLRKKRKKKRTKGRAGQGNNDQGPQAKGGNQGPQTRKEGGRSKTRNRSNNKPNAKGGGRPGNTNKGNTPKNKPEGHKPNAQKSGANPQNGKPGGSENRNRSRKRPNNRRKPSNDQSKTTS
ncbi:MAG: stage 0 sporulation family protein [Salibacteraceae bacterium]